MFVVGTPSAPLPPILGCLAAMSLYLKMFIVEWRIECTSVHLVLSVVGYLQQSTSFFFGRFATLTVKGQHFSGGKKQWQIPSKNYSDLELSDYSALGLANVSLEIELLINSSPKSFFFFFFLVFSVSHARALLILSQHGRAKARLQKEVSFPFGSGSDLQRQTMSRIETKKNAGTSCFNAYVLFCDSVTAFILTVCCFLFCRPRSKSVFKLFKWHTLRRSACKT